MKPATAESVMIYRFRPPAPTRRTPRRIAKRRGKEKAARGNPGGLSHIPTQRFPNYLCSHLGGLVVGHLILGVIG
jgi:hypothetical protein